MGENTKNQQNAVISKPNSTESDSST